VSQRVGVGHGGSELNGASGVCPCGGVRAFVAFDPQSVLALCVAACTVAASSCMQLLELGCRVSMVARTATLVPTVSSFF